MHALPSRLMRASFVALGLASSQALAQLAVNPPTVAVNRLKKLPLEDLMNVEVVSVSRHSERLAESASAIQVVTGEDIRRAGAETLPQALRLASNLQTAQISSSYWNIGARGMNSTTTTSNKLLVMIDGRTVYSPLVSGTYWDQRDVFLPDVDRIEVISGPGGSAWGANAVNGVINVLSKNSADTQGGLLYAAAGIEERALAGFRYGGRLGDVGHYRIYAKRLDYDGAIRSNRDDARNRWVFTQTGFRSDTSIFGRTELMVQGDFYAGSIQQPTSAHGEFGGGDFQVRWTIPVSAESVIAAQAFYDSARRGAPTTVGDRMDTVDLDVQHDWQLQGGRHRLVWGVGYRTGQDHVRNLATQGFLPERFRHELATAFVHGEIGLVPERLRLMVGTKYEHNNYSGSDHQPSARLAWRVNSDHTVWAAVSRAVRTPSRFERDIHIPVQPPYTAAGGPNFHSETVLATELGWRARIARTASISLSAYDNVYHGLRTLEQPVPYQFGNGLDADTYGAEVNFTHEVTEAVDWSLGYTWYKSDFHLKPWSRDLNNGQVEIADPEHQVQLRVSAQLSQGWEATVIGRYVDAIPTLTGRVISRVPAYSELDARLGWVSRGGWEVSLIGNNLIDRAHPEGGPANNRREIERSVHFRFLCRF